MTSSPDVYNVCERVKTSRKCVNAGLGEYVFTLFHNCTKKEINVIVNISSMRNVLSRQSYSVCTARCS